MRESRPTEQKNYKYSLPDDTFEECYKIAINNLDDAIDKDDEVAEYYYLRGKAKYYNSTLDYSAAKDDLQKAIELDDTVSDYYFYCARAWYGIGTGSSDGSDSEEALQNALNYINFAIKKYMKEDKILAEYYYYAGLIHVSIDGYDKNLREDIKNYQKAVSYDPGNAEYYSSLGISYYKREDLANAEGAFHSAILIDKANSDYDNEGYHLAWKAHVIEKDEARVQEAIEVYEASIKLKEDYAYSYRKLAELYEAENDTASVENTYSRAIRECVDNAEFYYARGSMYYDEDAFTYTIADMEKAIEGDSSNKSNAYYMIGSSYYMLQNYSKAYEYYQLAKDNGYSNIKIDEYMNTCLKHMEEE